jgi:outer membrane receptor protein involved in Fe transport
MLLRQSILVPFLLSILLTHAAQAQVFGTVRVTARDSQNLPLPAADVLLKAEGTAWKQSTTTNLQGEAVFAAVPIGHYSVSVSISGFTPSSRDIQVTGNSVVPVAMTLALAGVQESVSVNAGVQTINPESSRTETLTHRADIEHQPDADRAGSLAMITNNVPGAFVMHDHLHSRGGHGVTFQIDGVPVPNSNLASVGAQFDPKDVDYLESERGGLGANLGDRAYGVFNLVPRSGFEGSKFGDLTAKYGNYNQGSLYSSFGDHSDSQHFAYFASGSANRTDRGLERVDIPVLHDKSTSYSGFTSILYVPSASNQLRMTGSARTDNYEVPNVEAQQAIGIDDHEKASDALGNATWVHTSPSAVLVTLSPYYHYHREQYIGGENDPLITNDDRISHYVGGYFNVGVNRGKHSLHVGSDSFAEHDDSTFSLQANDAGAVTEQNVLWASVISAFADETYRATDWLTLTAGLRWERFEGSLTEYGTSPRLGTAIVLSHVGVLRASYGHFYQHPQTSTLSGPLLEFALEKGFGYLPVPGERDHMVEVGLGIPMRSWTLDVSGFYNKTKNLVDHEVLGNSNLLFPLTIDNGRVRAFESTLRSPLIAGRLRLHYALSVMKAEGRGAITGGLTDFVPPPNNEYFSLDHDQRVTFTPGFEVTLPRRFWASGNVIYGSGFLKGNGPEHMPQHTSFDLSAGKDFGENLTLRFTALNVTNELFLTGFENSFAGTHYTNPREISAQVRWKFHY